VHLKRTSLVEEAAERSGLLGRLRGSDGAPLHPPWMPTRETQLAPVIASQPDYHDSRWVAVPGRPNVNPISGA